MTSTYQTEAFAELNARLDRVLGDKTAKQFAALKVRTVGDLLRHVPRRYLSGTESSDLSQLVVGEEVAVLAEVVSAQIKQGRMPRLEAVVTDGHGRLTLTFFGKQWLLDYWLKSLHPGERGIFAGKVGVFQERFQLTHPDFVIIDESGTITGGAERNQSMAEVSRRSGLIGIYPATRQLPTWRVAQCAEIVLNHLGRVAEPWPAWVLEEADQPELSDALDQVHRPTDRELAEQGKQRLLFDEALSVQLAMAKRREIAAAQPATPRPRIAGGLLDALDARLPFTLTAGQGQVGEEIFDEIARSHPMQRLLQGEVGSGKTLVALRAMCTVIDSGGQVALLAPTEVLATQHYRSLTAMLGELADGGTLSGAENATSLVLLTGSMTTAQKRAALLKAASGEAGIVVGTHALLADQVQFADLGLIVIDEQHRFGVEQRAKLLAKAERRPHLLVMTATPIPRSVAMTVFGDLATSVLSEVPAGRSEVTTTVVDEQAHPTWVERAWQRIVEEVRKGRQAFVVCPRISEKKTEDDARLTEGETEARSVEDLYTELAEGPLKSLRVERVHGQLASEEKDRVMRAFAAGDVDVIVSTTVIEVGIDVPNASMMVISDADRFGISQLHQLRGRIGRGAYPGVCLLLTRSAADSEARTRLGAVAASTDGFRLAEVDLEQRREGDILGASQAGTSSSLRLLRVMEHADLIQIARTIADQAVALDPELNDPGFVDAVTQLDALSNTDWLERT